jgi:hypothetical protein
MPTTSELVTRIKNYYAQDYSRTFILDCLDRAQNELFNTDCAQSIFLNTSDDSFPIPILSTTTGTLEYEITGDNLLDTDGNAVTLEWNDVAVSARRVKSVFIQVTAGNAVDYTKLFYGERFDWAGINNNWSRRLYRVNFESVPVVCYDKTNTQNCKVVFVEDPGTHTDRYYVEFYFVPPSLTSENISLVIDANKWQEALLEGVMGYVEEIENGNTARLTTFRRYWKPRFIADSNKQMAGRRPLAMPRRECG